MQKSYRNFRRISGIGMILAALGVLLSFVAYYHGWRMTGHISGAVSCVLSVCSAIAACIARKYD